MSKFHASVPVAEIKIPVQTLVGKGLKFLPRGDDGWGGHAACILKTAGREITLRAYVGRPAVVDLFTSPAPHNDIQTAALVTQVAKELRIPVKRFRWNAFSKLKPIL